jgi:hypothetical protein
LSEKQRKRLDQSALFAAAISKDSKCDQGWWPNYQRKYELDAVGDILLEGVVLNIHFKLF